VKRSRHDNPIRRPAGFTLIELLSVVAILAILAGAMMVGFSGVRENAAVSITGTEILNVREAVLRFRKDTGFLPGQGPFALVADGGAIDPANATHWPPHLAGASAAEREAWFRSPANFYMLFANPLENTGHELEAYDKVSARGWHGPYLRREGEGFVQIRDGIAPTGVGSPEAGNLLNPVAGVADAFEFRPNSDGVFAWATQPGGEAHFRWGRPLLLLDTVAPAALTDPQDRRHYVRDRARVVGLGINGRYEDTDGDGLSTGDDLVQHLLK